MLPRGWTLALVLGVLVGACSGATTTMRATTMKAALSTTTIRSTTANTTTPGGSVRFGGEETSGSDPEQVCECVPYNNCDEKNRIITSGDGLIDVRINAFACEDEIEVCCLPPLDENKPTHTETHIKPGGGYKPAEPGYPVKEPGYQVKEPEYPVKEPGYPVKEPEYPVKEPGYPGKVPPYPVKEPSKPLYPVKPPQEPEYPVKEPLYPVKEPERPYPPLPPNEPPYHPSPKPPHFVDKPLYPVQPPQSPCYPPLPPEEPQHPKYPAKEPGYQEGYHSNPEPIHPEPIHPEPIHPEPIHPEPHHPEPTYPEPFPPSKHGCGYARPSHPTTYGNEFRITGGYEGPALTGFGEFPWMVALFKKGENKFLCGGSIIAPNIVLTGAHCIHNVDLSLVKVRAGEWDTSNTKEPIRHQDREVKKAISHDAFNPKNLQHNIALLFLVHPFDLTETVDVICLPPHEGAHYIADKCIATGWGKNEWGSEGKFQTILRKVSLPIVDRVTCEQSLRETRLGKYFRLHDSFICAGGNPHEDTCYGDGGGPLFCPKVDDPSRFVQVGITSWGIGCGGKTPAVYASVEVFSNWIREHAELY